MEDKNFRAVSSFVINKLWKPEKGIQKTTKLQDDFGLSGAEAALFMQDFSNEFDVDLSEFEFDRYFEQEANSLFIPLGVAQLLYYFIFDKEKPRNSVEPITVKDLVVAVEEGKWPA